MSLNDFKVPFSPAGSKRPSNPEPDHTSSRPVRTAQQLAAAREKKQCKPRLKNVQRFLSRWLPARAPSTVKRTASEQRRNLFTPLVSEVESEPEIFSTGLSHQLLGDISAESLLYSWMLVFALPSATTPQEESDFQSYCKLHSTTSLEVLEQAFTFVDPGGVKQVMEADLRYQTPINGDDGTSSKPLWSPNEENDQQSHALSLHRARQCSIELTLSFFQALDDSLKGPLQDQRDAAQKAEAVSAAAAFAGLDALPQRQMTPFPDKLVKVITFTSHKKDKFYICVRLDREVAEILADLTEYPVQLSREGVRALGIKLSDPNTTPAYAKYDAFFRKHCAVFPDAFEQGDDPTVLRPIDRIRLIYDKVTDSIDLMHMEKFGLLVDSLPLHHKKMLHDLKMEWATFGLVLSSKQPLDKVRDYFGEEIAFYFVLLHELVFAGWLLSLAGIICGAWSYVNDSCYIQARMVMSLVIMVWFRWLTKSWEQTEARFVNSWGLDQHATSTVKRLRNHRFLGDLCLSDENELELTPQVSPEMQVVGRALSMLFSSVFLVVIIIANSIELYGFYLLSFKFQSPRAQQFLAIGMGCLSGMQIKVVDSVWDKVSNWITDLEHRAEETDFQWSKSTKASIVRFVNTISSMIFFAFVRPLLDTGSCKDEANICLEYYTHELTMKLVSVFIVRFLFLGAFNDIVKPLMSFKMKMWRDCMHQTAFAERQDKMDTYESSDLTDDYLDVVLPVSFISFFGMVHPLCVLLLLPVLLIQVRADAWKLTHAYRRPYPQLAMGIGCFNPLMAFFGHCMIAINLGLMIVQLGGVRRVCPAFGIAMPQSWKLSPFGGNAQVFLTLAICLLLSWHLYGFAVPSSSFYVQRERRRQIRQRHNLFYSAACGSVTTKVHVSPQKLSKRVDFKRVNSLIKTPKGGVRPALHSIYSGPLPEWDPEMSRDTW